MKSDWKTPEFLANYPLGYLPAFEDGELHLSESGAIAEYGKCSISSLTPVTVAVKRKEAFVFMMRPILSYPCLN